MPKRKAPQRQIFSVRLDPKMIWDIKQRALDCRMTVQAYVEALLAHDIENKVIKERRPQ